MISDGGFHFILLVFDHEGVELILTKLVIWNSLMNHSYNVFFKKIIGLYFHVLNCALSWQPLLIYVQQCKYIQGCDAFIPSQLIRFIFYGCIARQYLCIDTLGFRTFITIPLIKAG